MNKKVVRENYNNGGIYIALGSSEDCWYTDKYTSMKSIGGKVTIVKSPHKK